ncbi:hypothetical protein ATN83_p20076 (plasmid) [Raoultella ornithinolytica]|nr:hypothetical protein ATN83_p20076 [Raoultella ornithinolytica]
MSIVIVENHRVSCCVYGEFIVLKFLKMFKYEHCKAVNKAGI